MLTRLRSIAIPILIGVAGFVLGILWMTWNPILLPRDENILQRFAARAADDMALHFKWSREAEAEIGGRTVITLRPPGMNCIVFATRQHVGGEWSYQACYSDDGKLLGLKAF